MPKRRALLLLATILALYVVSYLVASRDGYYEPTTFGVGTHSSGRPMMVPKFGYGWTPFSSASIMQPEGARWWSYFFLPIAELDRIAWHREIGLRNGHPGYPVKNYFDFKTRSSRDIP